MLETVPAYSPVADAPPDRLILRDGSVAALRPATVSDTELLRTFFAELSPDSQRQRVFASGGAGRDFEDQLTEAPSPAVGVTLVVTRARGSRTHLVGVGSYTRRDDRTAEVAFAVDDRFHGKGIATALLEHLAVRATNQGIQAFLAWVSPDNQPMLEVFRDAGLECRETALPDRVRVELSIVPTERSIAAAEGRERAATSASLRPVLCPRGVVVVGVSRHPMGIGRRVFDALIAAGYRGPLFAVNWRAEDLDGRPVYATVRDLPEPVELAVIAVPRDAVRQVVDDCAASGVKGIICLTAGFAEVGDAGRALQQQLVEQVRGYGMRLVGPNCMGVVNADPDAPLNASFSPIFPPHGGLALSSASGALGAVILALAARRHVGISSFASIGNRADVSSNDLLQYWVGDPATRVIALYLETFGNPRRFGRLARRIGREKPIIAIKSGRTRAGSKAAGSHTAALAASDVAVSALFRQAGVIRADTIDEMFDIAACLASQPLPRGRRVAIVTNAGGPGILAADACEAAGLTVAELSLEARTQLAAILPGVASLGNPVDMIASAGSDQYRRVIEVLLTAGDVDALLVLYTAVDPVGSAPIVGAIAEGVLRGRAAGGAHTPVLACLVAELDPGRLEAGSERIPVYAFPENAVRALGKIAEYAEWRAAPPGVRERFDDLRPEAARAICRIVLDRRGADWLTLEEVHRVLDAYGLTMVPSVLVRQRDEAASLAAVMGFPVVAKLSSPALVHKTEAGGVMVDLETRDAVASAFDLMAGAARARDLPFDGVLLQPMSRRGIETIIGMRRDPTFGPIVGFGLGGTEVEVLGDMRFRVVPVSDHDIADMIDETRAARLLAGHRGRPSADVAALTEILARVSRLAEDVTEISELDFTPVIAQPAGQGCDVVDVRIRVG